MCSLNDNILEIMEYRGLKILVSNHFFNITIFDKYYTFVSQTLKFGLQSNDYPFRSLFRICDEVTSSAI